MTIKELLDILQFDIFTFDRTASEVVDNTTGIRSFQGNGVSCKYIRRARCKQSEFLNKLYDKVNVLSYDDYDGKEHIIADWTGFIEHNKKEFENFCNIWGSKMFRLPEKEEMKTDCLITLWLEQFNHLTEPVKDDYFCMDLIKMIEKCEKAKQDTDGILILNDEKEMANHGKRE